MCWRVGGVAADVTFTQRRRSGRVVECVRETALRRWAGHEVVSVCKARRDTLQSEDETTIGGCRRRWVVEEERFRGREGEETTGAAQDFLKMESADMHLDRALRRPSPPPELALTRERQAAIHSTWPSRLLIHCANTRHLVAS